MLDGKVNGEGRGGGRGGGGKRSGVEVGAAAHGVVEDGNRGGGHGIRARGSPGVLLVHRGAAMIVSIQGAVVLWVATSGGRRVRLGGWGRGCPRHTAIEEVGRGG